jgi:hypothetical protein
MEMNGILPYFNDDDGNRWEVLSMNFCIDFGGRQCHIECQRNNSDNMFPEKTFVIYGISGHFFQWDSTECQSAIVESDSTFYTHVMDMFRAFDEVKNPDWVVPTHKG